MVTRQDAIEHLKSIGFDADTQDGVLMVFGTDNMKAVKKAVKESGYNGSYGCTNQERTDNKV